METIITLGKESRERKSNGLSRVEKSETSTSAEKVCQFRKSGPCPELQKGSECKDHVKGSEGELRERVKTGKWLKGHKGEYNPQAQASPLPASQSLHLQQGRGS